MDIVRLFTKKELIGGLKISDNALRFVLLDIDNKTKAVYVRRIAEYQLEEGVIVLGIIKRPEKLVESLKKLFDSLGRPKIDYAIVTISHINIYSRLFSFPKSIVGERLNEAMKMAIGFNLPVNMDGVYLDWEKNDIETKNEVYLGTAPKNIVESYLKAVEEAGMRPIAVESELLSFVRAYDLEDSKPILIVFRRRNQTGFAIVKNKDIRFSRFLPKVLTDSEIEEEAKRIANFYEVEDSPVAKIIDSREIRMPAKFREDPKIKGSESKWMAAVGAALRGLLPRSEDTLMSFLPVGTEEAYENQKKIVFINLISDLIVVICAILSVAFIAVWFLMTLINASFSVRPGALGALESGAALIEKNANEFNSYVTSLAAIQKKTPRWSLLLTEIKNLTTAEIIINSLNITDPSSTITISGKAKTRAALIQFEKSMKSSDFFKDVERPLTNLELRENIPFSLTFFIKDPESIIKRNP